MELELRVAAGIAVVGRPSKWRNPIVFQTIAAERPVRGYSGQPTRESMNVR